MRWAHENDWDDYFLAAAQAQAPRAGVDVPTFMALLKAHAGIESSFDPTAYHWDGPDATRNVSRGLMQIEGVTALNAGLSDLGNDAGETGPEAPRYNVPGRSGGLYDPAIAIPLAAKIIADNLQATGGNLPEEEAAYNEGLTRAAVDALAGGQFRDQAYVTAVSDAFTYFQAQQASGSAPASSGTGGGSTPLVLVGAAVALALLALLLLRHTTG